MARRDLDLLDGAELLEIVFYIGLLYFFVQFVDKDLEV
jgi:hypothetical protein